jgi:hypothetical protein
MIAKQKVGGVRFWRWITLAFVLGAAVGFAAGIVAFIVLQTVLQARISYAQ